MSNFHVAPDGADEPTIWERTDGDPAVVVRRAELPGPRADLLWRVLTGVLCADEETVEPMARVIRNCTCLITDEFGLHQADCAATAREVLAALRDAD